MVLKLTSIRKFSQSKSGVKKGIHWVGNYELSKKCMKKIFSIWQFVKLNKSIWNSRWNHFKSLMSTSPSVQTSSSRVNARWFGWSPTQQG